MKKTNPMNIPAPKQIKQTPAPKPVEKASPNPAKAESKANVKAVFGTPKNTK